jgi:hypothetical protein
VARSRSLADLAGGNRSEREEEVVRSDVADQSQATATSAEGSTSGILGALVKGALLGGVTGGAAAAPATAGTSAAAGTATAAEAAKASSGASAALSNATEALKKLRAGGAA